MLCISRYKGETFLVEVPPSDETTTIRVKMLKTGRRVRVGVEAPREVEILREELVLREQQERAAERAAFSSTVKNLLRRGE